MADKSSENPFYDIEQVASFTECTGLMPVVPQDEDQDENYASLYATHKGLKNRKLYRRR